MTLKVNCLKRLPIDVPNGYKIVTIAVADGGTSPFDYENKNQNSYQLRISINDGTSTVMEDVTISVDNVDDTAPVIVLTNTAPPTIAENTTAETDTGVTFKITDLDSLFASVKVYEADGVTESTLFKAVLDQSSPPRI